MVWDRECSQSKSQRGELYGSLGQWHTDLHHHTRVFWNSLSGHQASLRPHRLMSHLHRPGKHPHSTHWLCHYMGSGRWSPGLWWWSDSPHSPGLVQLGGLVPMILGTPKIGCIMNVIKESTTDTLAMPWVNAHVAYLLVVWWATATLEGDKAATRVLDPTKYDNVVTTKGCKMIDTFSSKIIHTQTKTAFTSVRLNVMTHILCISEGLLPLGLMIQNAYTEISNGSKNVAIVVRNSTAYLQTQKKIPVVRVVDANWLPELQVWAGMIDMLNEAQDIQTLKLTTEQRQEKLFEKLDLSGLESWLPELADSTFLLLAEYHDIFSLETVSSAVLVWLNMWLRSPMMPCLEINLSRFPPLVEEVCIDFCCLNAQMKKDSYPLPRIQEALESLVSTGHFSCLGLKSRFWQIKMDKLSKQYTAFTVSNLSFFECDCMPFGLCNTPAMFQRLMQNYLGELNLTYCLIYHDDIIVFL